MTNSAEITHLLYEWKHGSPQAAEELFDALMPELHRIATGCFARERGLAWSCTHYMRG